MEILDLPAVGALVPLSPLDNVLPALTISLQAFGVLERNGVWVLAGIGVAGAAVSVVSGVIFAMIKAGMYFLAQALS